MTTYRLFYKENETVEFELPEGWDLLNYVNPEPMEITRSIDEMVLAALAEPVGISPLEKTLKPGNTVAIAIDDWTRPTPVRHLLPALLKRLDEIGIKREDVTLIVALGSHLPMPEEALRERIGAEIFAAYRVVQHDCRADDLVSIGTLSSGGPVGLNKVFHDADYRISIGSIIPHPMNGFGGGPKIVMPGLVAYETIREHHTVYTIQEGAYPGNTETNPFYKEVTRVAGLANLNMILGALYTNQEKVFDVVAGHYYEAHQEGIRRCIGNFKVKMDEYADVTVLSAYPYTEGPQIMKPIGPAAMCTRRGGAVIILATTRAPMPEPMLHAFDVVREMGSDHPDQVLLDTFKKRSLVLNEAPIDFNMALFFTEVYKARYDLTIVSKEIKREEAERMGFAFADSIEEAIEKVKKKFPKAKVNVFPIGGMVLPDMGEPPRLYD
ncbi:MAG: nickel-dependent lactate racemase [Deltaproteobacteria bacterium]|nr:MAG: nickel-dependent lactate racemase [Deltaproteobacteria bacterium]